MLIYRGRFAPSPTGGLHFGSLIAAVGSYLQARSRNGQWLVRIEDLDPPREVPGSADRILQTLATYGLQWDGPVLYQSARTQAYLTAVELLKEKRWIYPCACTRREIAQAGKLGPYGIIYPNTCRNGLPSTRKARALRLKTPHQPIIFRDAIQGRISQQLAQESGDFVIWRADGLAAYQLAVVVDDAEQEVTEVVRGADLLTSTPRQIHLQQLLGLSMPSYMHLPVALDQQGRKLSKQSYASPIDERRPVPTLCRALSFLNQQPPPELQYATLDELWQWAIAHWQPKRIPTSQPFSQAAI